MNKLMRRLIPNWIRQKVSESITRDQIETKKSIEALIPKVELEKKHIQNCHLLLNRRELLTKLQKSGVVAELGVNRGDFSKLILELCTPLKLHLVDIWGSDRYHLGLYNHIKETFHDCIASGVVEIHKQLSVDAVTNFADDYFDFIYIDTSHSYETTRDELLKYEPKMKLGGIIAGHDYLKGNWITMHRYGVIEAVHEFCVKRNWELIYLTAEPTESQSFAIRRIN